MGGLPVRAYAAACVACAPACAHACLRVERLRQGYATGFGGVQIGISPHKMLQLQADLFSPSQRHSGAEYGIDGSSHVDSEAENEMRMESYADLSHESESTPPPMPFKKQRSVLFSRRISVRAVHGML